jgi:hypothetical protein
LFLNHGDEVIVSSVEEAVASVVASMRVREIMEGSGPVDDVAWSLEDSGWKNLGGTDPSEARLVSPDGSKMLTVTEIDGPMFLATVLENEPDRTIVSSCLSSSASIAVRWALVGAAASDRLQEELLALGFERDRSVFRYHSANRCYRLAGRVPNGPDTRFQVVVTGRGVDIDGRGDAVSMTATTSDDMADVARDFRELMRSNVRLDESTMPPGYHPVHLFDEVLWSLDDSGWKPVAPGAFQRDGITVTCDHYVVRGEVPVWTKPNGSVAAFKARMMLGLEIDDGDDPRFVSDQTMLQAVSTVHGLCMAAREIASGLKIVSVSGGRMDAFDGTKEVTVLLTFDQEEREFVADVIVYGNETDQYGEFRPVDAHRVVGGTEEIVARTLATVAEIAPGCLRASP